MKHLITKHANGMYEVVISTLAWKQSYISWLPFAHLYQFPEHKDLRKEINMTQQHGDEAQFTFKTNKETFEIIIDILSDCKYYDLTEMKEILNLM